jgi:hypothetical protein
MGLFDAFSSSDENQKFRQGFRQNKKFTQQGTEALQGGEEKAYGFQDVGQAGAIGAFQPLQQAGQKGMDAYWNLLQNPDSIYDSELYKSREAAGLDAINRGANARGMLASGNNTQDQLDYMRQGGLDYFNTLTGKYAPYFGLGQGAASGIAGAYTGTAANKANIATGTASGINNNYTNLGQASSDMYTNMANAGSAADANLWGAILGLGGMAAKAYGA